MTPKQGWILIVLVAALLCWEVLKPNASVFEHHIHNHQHNDTVNNDNRHGPCTGMNSKCGG